MDSSMLSGEDKMCASDTSGVGFNVHVYTGQYRSPPLAHEVVNDLTRSIVMYWAREDFGERPMRPTWADRHRPRDMCAACGCPRYPKFPHSKLPSFRLKLEDGRSEPHISFAEVIAAYEAAKNDDVDIEELD